MSSDGRLVRSDAKRDKKHRPLLAGVERRRQTNTLARTGAVRFQRADLVPKAAPPPAAGERSPVSMLMQQSVLLQQSVAGLEESGLWTSATPDGKILRPDVEKFTLLCKLNAEIRQNALALQRLGKTRTSGGTNSKLVQTRLALFDTGALALEE